MSCIVCHVQTVGYGDFEVQHEASKIFLCFYIIVSVTLLGLAIQNLYSLIRNRKVLAQRKELLVLQRKLHFLAGLNGGHGLNKYEFVLTILEHIGTLDHEKDIAPWLEVIFPSTNLHFPPSTDRDHHHSSFRNLMNWTKRGEGYWTSRYVRRGVCQVVPCP